MLKVDRVCRTIAGWAVPYDVLGRRSFDLPRRFPPGSLHWSTARDVRLLIEHNQSLRAGRALQLTEFEDGLWSVFKIVRGERGDRALEMAATTHRDLSIGLEDAEFRITSNGVAECAAARLVEVSLTTNPRFNQGVL